MSEPLLKNLEPLRLMDGVLITSVGNLIIALEPGSGRLVGLGVNYNDGDHKMLFMRAGQKDEQNTCPCGADIGPRSKSCVKCVKYVVSK